MPDPYRTLAERERGRRWGVTRRARLYVRFLYATGFIQAVRLNAYYRLLSEHMEGVAIDTARWRAQNEKDRARIVRIVERQQHMIALQLAEIVTARTGTQVQPSPDPSIRDSQDEA